MIKQLIMAITRKIIRTIPKNIPRIMPNFLSETALWLAESLESKQMSQKVKLFTSLQV